MLTHGVHEGSPRSPAPLELDIDPELFDTVEGPVSPNPVSDVLVSVLRFTDTSQTFTTSSSEKVFDFAFSMRF